MTRPPITVPPARIGKRYNELYCLDCGFQVSPLKLCACKAAAPASVAQGESAECADLERRIRDAQKATP